MDWEEVRRRALSCVLQRRPLGGRRRVPPDAGSSGDVATDEQRPMWQSERRIRDRSLTVDRNGSPAAANERSCWWRRIQLQNWRFGERREIAWLPARSAAPDAATPRGQSWGVTSWGPGCRVRWWAGLWLTAQAAKRAGQSDPQVPWLVLVYQCAVILGAQRVTSWHRYNNQLQAVQRTRWECGIAAMRNGERRAAALSLVAACACVGVAQESSLH